MNHIKALEVGKTYRVKRLTDNSYYATVEAVDEKKNVYKYTVRFYHLTKSGKKVGYNKLHKEVSAFEISAVEEVIL